MKYHYQWKSVCEDKPYYSLALGEHQFSEEHRMLRVNDKRGKPNDVVNG